MPSSSLSAAAWVKKWSMFAQYQTSIESGLGQTNSCCTVKLSVEMSVRGGRSLTSCGVAPKAVKRPLNISQEPIRGVILIVMATSNGTFTNTSSGTCQEDEWSMEAITQISLKCSSSITHVTMASSGPGSPFALTIVMPSSTSSEPSDRCRSCSPLSSAGFFSRIVTSTGSANRWPLGPKPESTEGRREDSGRGWVRELQGRWPGVLG